MNIRQFAIIVSLFAPSFLFAQQNRLAGPISSERSIFLSGNVHPKARPEFDQGLVDPSLKLDLVTLALKTTPQQQTALDQLLKDQQDRSSPNYRRWLTPDEYADQFGVSPADLAKIRDWLESQGFTVGHVARSRNWLTFSGTAAQISKALRTQIHRYDVDGASHFANATEPAIPTALEPIVLGFLGLDDFLPQRASARPRLTLPGNMHVVVPADIATIYDIKRLYQAGINGTGVNIAIPGQSDIDLADVAQFRTLFDLPDNVPQVVQAPSSADPGTTPDQDEADLDVEWAGAVAPNAQIIYVKSKNAVVSALYAISQKLAPIVSFSFGGCEASEPALGRSTAMATAAQGNAEGITWIAASGDAGPASCDKAFSSAQAARGLAVSFPASLAEVTAVGGVQFNEGTGSYWSDKNFAGGQSVLSYIPETAWNESDDQGLAATGGGFSKVYPQPSWQVGPGLPPATERAVPDVALTSAFHDGYIVVTTGETFLDFGTSTATPTFAGIIALLNQKEASGGVGNINPNLYRLAQTGIFHDITTGDNIVPCTDGSPDCSNGSIGYAAGPGYDPVTGLGSIDAYNLVMQWNAATPASKIVAASTPASVPQQPADAHGNSWFYTVSLTETAGVATSLTGFTVNGVDLSSQIATLFGSSTIPAHGTIAVNRSEPAATGQAPMLFGFTGVDGGGRQWTQQLSVQLKGTSPASPPVITAVANAASYKTGLPSGGLASLFGTHISPVSGVESSGGALSYKGVSITVGGHLAPLYAVANVNGQEQINFQVPTEPPVPGAAGIVQVNNNGSVGVTNLATVPTQPGIFEYIPAGSATPYGIIVKLDGSLVSPSNPAARGSTVVIYATGIGPMSPDLATGQPGPIPLSFTINPVTATISDVGAQVLFSGAAPFFVGLDQLNVTIPAEAPVSPADTITLTVNGVTSPPIGIAIN